MLISNSWFLLLIALWLTSCDLADDHSSNLAYGVVSSASPEATQAGMAILRNGGNAVDAAIAVSFVLNVTEPAMSGLGGGTQVLLRIPGQRPVSIDGSTLSPQMTPRRISKSELNEYQRTTVPSTVKVMEYLFAHYGSGNIEWADLLEEAIGSARGGYFQGSYRYQVYEAYGEKVEKGLPSTRYYQIDSTRRSPPNPRLARAMEVLAEKGARSFYSGEIAETIATDMAGYGGWITLDDLSQFPEPALVQPVHFKFGGYDVYTQPEPCGGWTVKEILTRLEVLRSSDPDVAFDLHLAESIRYGHAQRAAMAAYQESPMIGETTHFSVMDASGVAVSITSSINAYYGSGVANPVYGFLYNSYMDDYVYGDTTHRFAVGPGKSAYSSMSPSIVMKGDSVVLVIGSPGSARIISTVAQLIARYCLDSVDPERLHEFPRIHALDSILWVETDEQSEWFGSRLGEDVQVKKRPLTLSHNGLNPYFGGVHMIVKTSDGYLGLADVRRDGRAITD